MPISQSGNHNGQGLSFDRGLTSLNVMIVRKSTLHLLERHIIFCLLTFIDIQYYCPHASEAFASFGANEIHTETALTDLVQIPGIEPCEAKHPLKASIGCHTLNSP
jgi:hypothetical protein